MLPTPPTRSPSDGESALLRVSKLTVAYDSAEPTDQTLRGLNFEIAAGEVVGVLGESGGGKSTLALALLGLLPPRSRMGGEIVFRSRDLLGLSEAELRSIRGAGISLIYQEPGLALSPVMRVGDQIAEVMRAHLHLEGKVRRQEVKGILRDVQLHNVDRIYNAYPHQLSGGELHRVVIAQALACQPDLIVADEPIRALDARTQSEILQLLQDLNQNSGTAILFITHNPAVLAGLAHRVLVMYAGRIVEQGTVAEVFRRPLHPYTAGLLRLVPQSLRGGGQKVRGVVNSIPSGVPSFHRPSKGCRFEPQCAQRMPGCALEDPGEFIPEKGRRVSCFVYGN